MYPKKQTEPEICNLFQKVSSLPLELQLLSLGLSTCCLCHTMFPWFFLVCVWWFFVLVFCVFYFILVWFGFFAAEASTFWPGEPPEAPCHPWPKTPESWGWKESCRSSFLCWTQSRQHKVISRCLTGTKAGMCWKQFTLLWQNHVLNQLILEPAVIKPSKLLPHWAIQIFAACHQVSHPAKEILKWAELNSNQTQEQSTAESCSAGCLQLPATCLRFFILLWLWVTGFKVVTVLTTKAKCKAARNMELALVRELHKAGVDFDCYVEFEFSQRTPGGPSIKQYQFMGTWNTEAPQNIFFLWASHATLCLVPVRHLMCRALL